MSDFRWPPAALPICSPEGVERLEGSQVTGKPHRCVVLGGVFVDLCSLDELAAEIGQRLRDRPATPLAVASANLDHIRHFGTGRAGLASGGDLDWLVLLDGHPLVRRASALTGHREELLTGADALPHLMDVAEGASASVGFLGGTEEAHERLGRVLADRNPGLKVSGLWSPPRTILDDPMGAARVADDIAAAAVDLLVVGLGKPRQERWIQRYGRTSGAHVLLAFGASADFLAGTSTRAPRWIRNAGFEWADRLAREPRRLGRRYCIEGPSAFWHLWTDSYLPSARVKQTP
jgi:N-acetylglucosaminyldiphosphoundecaprenol N-acetyl-beta-D-mannosaminyltransferase